MKEFIEKLIGRLEDLQQYQIEKYTKSLDEGNLACIYDKTDIEDTKVRTVWKVLDIVNQLAEEYNGGWIDCSERLPETDDDVLCWYEYYRFGEYNGMYQTWGIGHYYKSMDFWGGEVSNGHKCRVIAWQPLPAPYNPKGE